MLSSIITGNSITILINNRPEIIDNTHPNFTKVENALKAGASENTILELMNVSIAVTNFGEGKVQVKDGEITYLGKPVHSSLSVRILSLMENGFDISPFTNFMENLYQNPSKSSVDDLYGFLEACNLPITEDGYFLAYKKIDIDYKDCYTHTLDNSIGATVSMPRYEVNEDNQQTCSTGLHVASYSYMSSYSGARIVICKVHPKDVVAVPKDYNNAKMRVCEYIVVNEVALKDETIASNVISDEDVYSEDYETGEDSTEVEEIYPKDEDIGGKGFDEDCIGDVPHYDTCEDMLEEVDVCDYYELVELYEDIPAAKNFLAGVNVSTSFWKRSLIEILHKDYGFTDCPDDSEETEAIKGTEFYTKPEDKVKFGVAISNYLLTFDIQKWNTLSAVLLTKNVNINGLMGTAFELKDEKVVVNKLKSLAKQGEFKKSTIIKALGL